MKIGIAKYFIHLSGRLAVFLATTLIKIYKIFFSSILPASCRYYPSCSSYSLEAFKKHGFFKGLFLSGWRILRCNPYCRGGYDPVPEKFSFFKSK